VQRSCAYDSSHKSVRCNLTVPNGVSASYLVVNENNWDGTAIVVQAPSKPRTYTTVSAMAEKRAPSIFLRQYLTTVDLNSNRGANMFTNLTDETEWIATECSLELYVRRVNSPIQNSIYQGNSLSTWSEMSFNQITIPESDNGIGANDGIYFSIVVSEFGAQITSTFYIGYEAHQSLTGLLANLNGIISGSLDTLHFGSTGINVNTVFSDILQSLFTQNFTNCATPTDRLRCMMGNVAGAISKTFREFASNCCERQGA
jgi:hypothetical protein